MHLVKSVIFLCVTFIPLTSCVNIRCRTKYDDSCPSTDFLYCDVTVGLCKCFPNYAESNNACVPKTKASCYHPGRQCIGLPNSHCSRAFRCACNLPFIDNGTDCINLILEKASLTQERNFNNRQFNNNPATNIADILKMVENKIQLQYPENLPNQIYQQQDAVICLTDFDCNRRTGNTICIQGKCQCQTNFIELNGRCYPGIGKPCNPEVPCFVKNSMCDGNSLCACEYGYKVINNQCVAGVGNICSTPLKSPCFSVPHSFCNSRSICACEDGYFETQGLCSPKSNATSTVLNDILQQIGSKCSKLQSCSLPHSYCNQTGFCSCSQGYDLSQDGSCESSTLPGVSCVIDNDACTQYDPYMVCSTKQNCICKEKYTLIYGQCYPDLNSPCSDQLQCGAINSYCSDLKLCKCKDGYKEDQDRCVSD